jgi:site-specific recombinase XerD
MINRNNKKIVDRFLEERQDDDLCKETIKVLRDHLILLLEFSGDTDFKKMPQKYTGKDFKEYLRTIEARRDLINKLLSPEYCRKALGTSHVFFAWLQDEKGFKRTITNKWIKTFHTNHKWKQSIGDCDQVMIALDEARRIANTPVKTLNEERTRAACIFLFLTGMRIGAFVTLPIKAVNISHWVAIQDPEMGVQTKLGKSGKTKLARISDLLTFVEVWDQKVRTVFPPDGLWFAPISPLTGLLDSSVPVGENRASGFRKDLHAFLKIAAIEYKSPHKFRHGYIRMMRDQAKDVSDLEALAGNTLQKLGTMLEYGRMSERQRHQRLDDMSSLID